MLLLQDLTGEARNISLHWHRSLELDLITAGKLTVTINDHVRTVSAPGLILVNSGDLHELHPLSSRIKAVTLLISYDFICSALPNYDEVLFDLNGDQHLITEIERTLTMIGTWYRQQTPGYQLLIGGQLYQLLYWLSTRALVSRASRPAVQWDYRIKDTLTQMHANYQSPLVLAGFAQKYHLSTTYFSHLFRQEVGLSFRDYLLNLRVEMAQHQLMTTDLKIIDIALSNGFGSAQRLIAAFKKVYGIAPNVYRHELLGGRRGSRESKR